MRRTKEELERMLAERDSVDEVIKEFVNLFDKKYDVIVNECKELEYKVGRYENRLKEKSLIIEKIASENKAFREMLKLDPKLRAPFDNVDTMTFSSEML